MLIETFIRKQLRLKAHTVTRVEESDTCLLVHIDRLGKRLLRCGVCRQRCLEVHDIRKEREWRDLSMRKLPLKLRYHPRRVACPRCGVRVEDFPWAEPWARVTTTLSPAQEPLWRTASTVSACNATLAPSRNHDSDIILLCRARSVSFPSRSRWSPS